MIAVYTLSGIYVPIYFNYVLVVFFPFAVLFDLLSIFITVPIAESTPIILTWAQPIASFILIMLGLICINPD
jgi:hypothetical protein